MNILHYSLGFPPYRSGGLTKFCVDLMEEQLKDGHQVSMLWPGQIYGKTVRIKNHADKNGIHSYEMVNPLPVPYDEGITEIDAFIKDGEDAAAEFSAFLHQIKPQIIHIHTFMGLYSSFIDTAREMGIRTVFTTHDFFPICPKVTMYRHGKICETVNTCLECPQCNSTALGLRKIQLLQSSFYRSLKDTPFVKKLRKHHRDEYLNEEVREQSTPSQMPEDYIQLRAYYSGMLQKVDIIHYNSSVTQGVYEQIFGSMRCCRIPISHSAISDNRRTKKYDDNLLRIRYLGPQGGVKGFFLLKAALDGLCKERQDFCLDIHFAPMEPSPYMRVHRRYDYSKLEKIFEETDVLVAPSIWYETFGYTVLEALSYGVPVIISGTVGAKDILAEGAGIVIDNITSEKLLGILKDLTTEQLSKMNESIVKRQKIMTLEDMTDRIIKECYLEG